ncbi:MAG TPA: hypothetical protein VEY11_17430 [Pyrinomonadaceae bacterium]|nr:hypothetical protein [Pyrinomonadaceae bacterium]
MDSNRARRYASIPWLRISQASKSVAHDLGVPTLNDHVPDLLEELAYELEDSFADSMIRGLKKESC